MRDTAPANSIWAELSRRGVGIKDLAKETGYSPHFCTMVVNGWSASPRARRKIEAYLRTPIWSSPAGFNERLASIDYFCCDVETLSCPALIELCQRHNLMSGEGSRPLRSKLIQKLLNHQKTLTPHTHEKARH